MDTFFYKEPYEENGKTILEVNLFPDKYCNYINRKGASHTKDCRPFKSFIFI